MTTERWALVPVEATPEMYERGRDAITAREVSSPNWSVAQHYDASGNSTAGIPIDLLECVGKMPKGDCAEMVYAAMIHESPGAALLAEVLAARDAWYDSGDGTDRESLAIVRVMTALDKLGPAADGAT